MLSKKSKIEQLARSHENRFLAASAAASLGMYEALWSPSCDSMWSLTLARAGRASGAEKFSSPARKPFFRQHRSVRDEPTCPRRRQLSSKAAIAATRWEVGQGSPGGQRQGGISDPLARPLLEVGRFCLGLRQHVLVEDF